MKQTPEDVRREINKEIVQKVLTEKRLQFSIDRLVVEELMIEKKTGVECKLSVKNLEGKSIAYDIKGVGRGLLDALFNALVAKLVDDCHSLSNLRLEEFQIFVDENDLKELRRQGKGRGTDAHVEVALTINNGCGKLIPFRSRSRSMIAASVDVVSKTIEFFVNSERAVLRLKWLIEDSCSRNRGDLTEQYTHMLSSLVYNTSYEKSLKKP